jgi:hypothetical protein
MVRLKKSQLKKKVDLLDDMGDRQGVEAQWS